MTLKVISQNLLSELEYKADESLRKRQHYNIHDSSSDPCQRLLNAVSVDSYIRPHRHALDPKDECLVAAKGLFGLIVFTAEGEPQMLERFGSEKYMLEGKCGAFGVEVSAGVWHTVVPLVPGSVLFEVKAGPFDPDAAKEFACWSPEEQSEEAESYLSFLKSLFL